MKNIEDIEDLDDTWIKEFEKQDNEYKNFYKEDIHSIKIRFIYINTQNSIEKIKEEVFILYTKNYLSREEIVNIIKHNNTINDINYNLLSILKYNINIEPNSLKTYLKNKENDDIFLTSIRNIDTILFSPTITLFHDLNCLFILFYPKIYNPHNRTKKIYIKEKQNKSKTFRNTFKDI